MDGRVVVSFNRDRLKFSFPIRGIRSLQNHSGFEESEGSVAKMGEEDGRENECVWMPGLK